jgi:putative FmdB family regulatory protein
VSWITHDYLCETCGERSDHLVERGEVPDHVACPVCGAQAVRVPGGHVTTASYVDGSGRFDHLREQGKLRRELRKAVRRHDFKEAARIQRETTRIK